MADDEAVTHRLRQVDAPLDLLLEALRLDVELGLTVSVAALDRVAEEDLPVLVEAVVRHLPARGADKLGLQLLLQAPEFMQPSAHLLSDQRAYLWLEERWEGDRELVLLPAHHLVLPEGVVRTDPVTGWAALSAPSPTWHPRTPAVGHGRIGGELPTCCPECGWELHRLLDLGTFPGADDRELPGELVTCVAFNCTWDEQFFDHADGAARPIERPARPRADWQPRPEVLPVLPVSFHPAPARWQLQDWMWSNGTQNLNRLGGAASWIQDAIYPSCPRCRRSMPVVAQVDGLTPFDDIVGWESWTDGLMYAFWCRECRVSAVSTQQT